MKVGRPDDQRGASVPSLAELDGDSLPGNLLVRIRASWRVILAVFIVGAAAILLNSYQAWRGEYASVVTASINQRHHLMDEVVNELHRGLDHVRRDILIVQSLVRVSTAGSSEQVRRQLVTDELVGFAKVVGDYFQLRWIGNDGREQVRIERSEPYTYIVTGQSQLQDKSMRYYVKEAFSLMAGSTYLTAIDLNVEEGKIEEPWRPTLRALTPFIDSDGKQLGLWSLNLDVVPLLDAATYRSDGTRLQLINDNGYWLAGHHPAALWGHLRGLPEHRLAVVNPRLWQAMQDNSDDHGQYQDTAGIWMWHEFDTGAMIHAAASDSSAPQLLRLISLLPQAALIDLQEGVIRDHLQVAAPLLLLVALMAVGIGVLTASRTQAWQAVNARGEALAHTVDQLQQLNQRLVETREELVQSEKLSSLGLMVAGVAHELNTPIGGTLLAVSTLQDDLDEFSQRYRSGLRESDVEWIIARGGKGLGLATGQLGHAARLIQRFKQLATDRASAERRSFLLDELIDEVNVLFEHRIEKLPQRIDYNVPQGVTLDSYPGPLGQVLENLISNALNHAFPDGGTITVTVEADTERVQICVDDDGIGIDAAIHESIFDPFFTTRRGSGGTGLGLHIAHQLATVVLGGSLVVANKQGVGARFVLDIPLTAPPHEERQAEEVVGDSPGSAGDQDQ